MTENEAKAFLEIEKQCINRNCDRNCAKCDIVQKVEDLNSAYDTAIKALEEVQQYRQIGTVSTCRNAVGICKTMIERGINPDNITECIKFEYNLVQRGYDLKKLIEIIDEHKQQFQIGTVEKFREAIEKQTKKKPEFLDTRFMYNGKHISDGCQLQKCYKCPNCNHHIFHVWDDELYCKYCGQHIDWSDEDGKTD
jgi:urocanate hydratase